MHSLIRRFLSDYVWYMRAIIIVSYYLVNTWLTHIEWQPEISWSQLIPIIIGLIVQFSLIAESARVGFHVHARRYSSIVPTLSNQRHSVLFSVLSLVCILTIAGVIKLPFGSVTKEMIITIALGSIGGYFTAIVNKR